MKYRHKASGIVAEAAAIDSQFWELVVEPPARPTVRVRAIVAIMPDGGWRVYGDDGDTDEDLREYLGDVLDAVPDQIDFIEVSVPVRYSETIQGVVSEGQQWRRK